MGCGGSKDNAKEPQRGAGQRPTGGGGRLATSTTAGNTSRQKTELNVKASDLVKSKLGAITEDYEMLESLGSGAFAEVKKAKHKATSNLRAIKVLHKAGITSDLVDPKFKLREQKILQQLDNPHILKCYEFYEDRRRYYIVMEYCAGGDLFSKLLDTSNFTEAQAAKIMFQLLSAVNYCHTKKVLHRDLKPENILLETKGMDLDIKIADFGSSAFFDVNKRISGIHGSAYYVAPEVLKESYNEKCDIWSCGIIMYILMTGRPPYPGKSQREILEAVKEGELTLSSITVLSPEAQDLIQQMLNRNFKTRISAREALEHPWIKKNKSLPASGGQQLRDALGNMRAFNATSKLKDAIHTFIATQIANSADLKDLKEAFRAIDKNSDGRVSKSEMLEEYRKVLGDVEAEAEVKAIMSRVDTDNSGFIDYSEFLHAALDNSKHLNKQNLETVFRMFDKDSSGKISTSELRDMLSGGGEVADNVWSELISEVDRNGDGEIDIKEFEQLIQRRV